MFVFNDADIAAALPNAIAPAAGEVSLAEKLAPFVAVAAERVEESITGRHALTLIEQAPPADYTRVVAKELIVHDALLQALPALDLVCTPNGFGVVQTQTVAPASPQRIERLARSLLQRVNYFSGRLIDYCGLITGWADTPQADALRRSLMSPTLLVQSLDRAALSAERLTDAYARLAPQMELAENDLALRFFSPELLLALRMELQLNAASDRRRQLARVVSYLALRQAQGGRVEYADAAVALHLLTEAPLSEFPEWNASPQAKAVLNHECFNNVKSDGAFFF